MYDVTAGPGGAPLRTSAGAFAIPISTVGAAHSSETDSAAISSNTRTGSTLRRHTCLPPTAVTVHTNPQTLA